MGFAVVAVIAAGCAAPPTEVAGGRDEAVVPSVPSVPPTAVAAGTWQPLEFATRAGAEAVWTGEDVLVFTRADPEPEDRSVVHLDPRTGMTVEASPDATSLASSIAVQWAWTGRELVVWMLVDDGQHQAQGVAYDPAARAWRRFETDRIDRGPSPLMVGVGGAPLGEDVLVWSHGRVFDPVSGVIRAVAAAPLVAHVRPAVAWSTQLLLVWSGPGHADGAAYVPAPTPGRPWPGHRCRRVIRWWPCGPAPRCSSGTGPPAPATTLPATHGGLSPTLPL